MAVLDVAIPTGYWIQQQKLDSYVLSNRVRNLRRAKYLERKIVFYFDYVSVELLYILYTFILKGKRSIFVLRCFSSTLAKVSFIQ